MTKKTTRTAALVGLAGTMALGMSACTQVGGTAEKATSSATSAASDAQSSATSAADSATSQTSSESSTPTTSESSSSSSTSESDSTDSASGPQVGKVGQEVKTDKMSVKVSKINESVTSTSSYEKPDSGKHWVGVNISVTNLADKELSFTSSCVKVRLTDNTSPTDEYVSYGTRIGSGTLYKGDTSTGDLVYQVPSGQKIKTVDVDCSYGEDQAIRVQAN